MPPIRRIIKKTTYAVSFVGVLALLIVFLVLPRVNFFRPAVDPPTQERESIVIENVDVVTHNDTVDIVARIRNPNPRVGVPEYTVTFILLDEDGNELEAIPKQTYLLPGSLNYIAALDIKLSSALDSVKVDTPDEPIFAPPDKTTLIPSFNSFLRDRRIRRFGDRRLEVQKGVVTNTSTLGYRTVDVTGVALDKEDKVVGIGKTFVQDLHVGEQREFTLQWPEPDTKTAKVIILLATNIYRDENILRPQGDPNLLRQQPVN